MTNGKRLCFDMNAGDGETRDERRSTEELA